MDVNFRDQLLLYTSAIYDLMKLMWALYGQQLSDIL